MFDIALTIILLIVAYLLGSIPFGLLFGKLNGVDIREHGSKNIGTTNTIRVLGKKIGFTAFVFEVLKGAVVIILVRILIATNLYDCPLEYNGVPIYILFGAPSMFGHVFSIFLKFKGGKAVAVSLGIVLSITPIPALLCLLAFYIVLKATGYVSLGSTVATLTVVISTWIIHNNDIVTCVLYTILSLLIIFKHKSNYVRLIKGTESSFKNKNKNNEINKNNG